MRPSLSVGTSPHTSVSPGLGLGPFPHLSNSAFPMTSSSSASSHRTPTIRRTPDAESVRISRHATTPGSTPPTSLSPYGRMLPPRSPAALVDETNGALHSPANGYHHHPGSRGAAEWEYADSAGYTGADGLQQQAGGGARGSGPQQYQPRTSARLSLGRDPLRRSTTDSPLTSPRGDYHHMAYQVCVCVCPFKKPLVRPRANARVACACAC